MKKETNMKPEAALAQTAETAAPAAFKCPNCMMADTCGRNCPHWEGDSDGSGKGWCGVHGGWTDYTKWCCPWYYEN